MRAPLTPMKAFVHDSKVLGVVGVTTADDPRLPLWFAVAQAAERLAAFPPSDRIEYLRVLGEGVLPERVGRPTQIEGDGRAPADTVGRLAERLRMEVEDMERAGCFELALTTVSAVCQLLSKGSAGERLALATSRLLATAHLGRVNRQMGDLEAAADCYKAVTEDATALADGPVAAHGFVGLGNVAHARGNRPAQKRFFEQALQLAVAGSPIELLALEGLMIAANALNQWASALLHGWRAHDLAPPDSEQQLSILINLANTALGGGFYLAAFTGCEFVIQRAFIARLRLPTIGTAMRAAARLGRVADVTRMEKLGRLEQANGSSPFDASRFLLWAAESWYLMKQHDRVDALIIESLSVAENFGFHEVEMKAERLREDLLATIRRSKSSEATVVDDPMRRAIGRMEALSIA